jgi:hypothetical protein
MLHSDALEDRHILDYRGDEGNLAGVVSERDDAKRYCELTVS